MGAFTSASPFGEFVEHWTAPGFAGYVDALGELATLVDPGRGIPPQITVLTGNAVNVATTT